MGGCKSICLKVKEKDLDFEDTEDKFLKSNGQENINNTGNDKPENNKQNKGNNEFANMQSVNSVSADKLTIQENNNKNINKNETGKSDLNKKTLENINDVIIDGNLIVGKATGNVNENYKSIKKLGEGSYGMVYLVNHNYSGQQRAMKIIQKKNVENSQKVDTEIMNEIEILKKMDHPNIVKIFEFYNSTKNYYLITEYCKEGELFDKIVKEGPFDEDFASYIMYQIFSAVNYCHSMSILHRDLKPENILIERKEKNGLKIKIIDFGTAKIFENNKVERKIIGSSYYIAPEVLSKNYNEKCDLWSCGVILYILLSASPPFSGRNDNEIIENIKRGYYDIESNIWQKISPEAKNLIRSLLERNVGIRINAEEALNHKWFKKLKTKDKFNFVTQEKIKSMLGNLKTYSADKMLQRIALAYLVHNNPQHEEVLDACKLFNLIDKNSNGKITKLELQNGMNELSVCDEEESQKLVDEIFNLIDGDNNGYIEYEEFVRGCINKEKFITEDIIKFSFRFFDKDNNGEITFEEIKVTFAKSFKKDINNWEGIIKNIIEEVDTNKDGKISYQEFKNMMHSILEK